jgi:hypothetical protein
MSKEMEEYISRRCDDALNNDAQYMELQDELTSAYNSDDIEKYSEIFMRLQNVIEKVCYKTAAIDILA